MRSSLIFAAIALVAVLAYVLALRPGAPFAVIPAPAEVPIEDAGKPKNQTSTDLTTKPPVSSATASADELLPKLDPAQQEIHGRLFGNRFWARLLTSDKQFGGNRKLELVYTPPAPAAIAGTVLSDCPFLLLDDHARIVAWNGREGLSNVLRASDPDGYKVSREVHESTDVDAPSTAKNRTIGGARAFDLHLAPLLVALAWRPEGTAKVPVVDLFGARAAENLEAGWSSAGVEIAGERYTVEPDPQGRLLRLRDAKGVEVVTIEGRK
jgi:hypothetical protein